jgi:hypothetical protein
MSDDQKPMFSKDEERRPLLTEEEPRDSCFHDAATIVVAIELGCPRPDFWRRDRRSACGHDGAHVEHDAHDAQ